MLKSIMVMCLVKLIFFFNQYLSVEKYKEIHYRTKNKIQDVVYLGFSQKEPTRLLYIIDVSSPF